MQAELLTHPIIALADGVRVLLEGLSVLTVLAGLLVSLARCRRRPPLQVIRTRFGSWLSLALEFQLGADIVATTASPNRDNLIQLAVVAVIRTLLNVFLARELEASHHDPG
jgi:uncharacterized membrane protein